MSESKTRETEKVEALKVIWFIDDDIINNLLSERLMKKHHPDCECRTFNGAEEPLDLLSQENPELPYAIFLDINMPRMSGWDFLDEFVKLNIDISVFMLTSSLDPHDVKKADDYSVVVDFISKPLKEERLKVALGDN